VPFWYINRRALMPAGLSAQSHWIFARTARRPLRAEPIDQTGLLTRCEHPGPGVEGRPITTTRHVSSRNPAHVSTSKATEVYSGCLTSA